MNIDESFSEGWPFITLAEMTGKFHTPAEAIMATFMRILVKMKMTKHSLWQIPQVAAILDRMYKMLWKERNAYLGRVLTQKKPGPLEGQWLNDGIVLVYFKDVHAMIFAIEEIRNAAEYSSVAGEELSSPFHPWETIKVLAALLGSNVFEMKVADRVGVEGVPQEIERIRTTAVQFTRMRDKVLSLVSEGLVPFTSLVVDGLCWCSSSRARWDCHIHNVWP